VFTAPARVYMSVVACNAPRPHPSPADRYDDWWARLRRPGTVVRYGQAVQLGHAGTGELCGTRLVRGGGVAGDVFEMGLDTAMPDPYLEGR
jgi:hypothetical protein